MIFIYLISASEMLPVGAGTDWKTFVYSAVFSIATIGTGLWMSRKKQKTDDFSTFMKTSSEYREEIRKELARKEAEYTKELAVAEHSIDKLKELNASLEKTKENLLRDKALLNYLPQMIWYADAKGEIQFFNQRWYEYTGLNFEQSLNDGWLRTIHPDDLSRAKGDYKKALSEGHGFTGKYRIKRYQDGEYRLHLLKILPTLDTNGMISQWIGSYTDITET